MNIGFSFDSFSGVILSAVDAVLGFILLFVLLGVGLRLTTWLIRRGVRRRHLLMRSWDSSTPDLQRTESIERVLITAARALFAILAIVLLLASVNVNLGAILTSVSLLTVAVGFGAQYLVRDYLSGILLLTEDQYRVGDWVELNKVSGTVEDMRLRLTVLRDANGTVHHIPNGEIRVASNRSKVFSKINQDVSVGYQSNLRQVFQTIDAVGAAIATDPAWTASIRVPLAAIRVQELGENGIIIRVIGETMPGKAGPVAGEFRLRLVEAFAAAGIEISYPQLVVRIDAEPRGMDPGSKRAQTGENVNSDVMEEKNQ